MVPKDVVVDKARRRGEQAGYHAQVTKVTLSDTAMSPRSWPKPDTFLLLHASAALTLVSYYHLCGS